MLTKAYKTLSPSTVVSTEQPGIYSSQFNCVPQQAQSLGLIEASKPEELEQSVRNISDLIEKRATSIHGLYYWLGRLIGTIDKDGNDTGWYPLDRMAEYLINWSGSGENEQVDSVTDHRTDSVLDQSITTDFINRKLLQYYDHLENKIRAHQKIANQNGKALLIIIGESHYLDAENYIQHMILNIASKLGISKFFHEYPKHIDLKKVLDYCDIGYLDSFNEDIEAVQKYQMQYIPIDTYERTQTDYTTDAAVIKARNKVMVENINNEARWGIFRPTEPGVVIIGGHHMIGLTSSLEGHAIDRAKYEVLEINLFKSDFDKTIDPSLSAEVTAYYNSQDQSYFPIVKELEEMLKANSNDVRVCFNSFIKEKDFPRTENTLLFNFPGRLKRAVLRGETLEFDRLLSLAETKDIDHIDCTGYGLLHEASRTSLAMTEFVLSRGASINLKDKQGRSALFHAVKEEKTDIIRLLLNEGIDLDDTKSLFHAASYGKNDIVKILLEYGMDINIKDDSGNTALHAVAQYGMHDSYIFLLNHGADPTIENNLGLTAAEYAAFKGKKVGNKKINCKMVNAKIGNKNVSQLSRCTTL